MTKNLFLSLILCFAFFSISNAQDYFPTNSGVKENAKKIIAFTNATIQLNPNEQVKNATLVIEGNKILEVGTKVKVPANARVIDVKGKYIYPSFIESYSSFGMKSVPSASSGPQYEANRKGYYWNDHVRPEQDAIDYFTFNEAEAKKLRDAGFGLVNTHLNDGLVKGTSALVALVDDEEPNKTIIDKKSAQYLGLSRSKQTRQSYPSSIMGMTALLRQLNYDANWYAKGKADYTDLSLEAFIRNKDLPQIAYAGNYLNVLRLSEVGKKFNQKYIIYGGGDEYKRLSEIKATQNPLIIPVNFPDAYDVEDPYMAHYVSLEEMKHWQLAPKNPSFLAKEGVPFALTTNELDEPKKVHEKIQKAIENGLTKEDALAALTTNPALFINKQNEIGKIAKGFLANFLITSGDIFEKETLIYENWVAGVKHEINKMTAENLEGDFEIVANDEKLQLKITKKSGKYSSEVKKDSLKLGSKLNVDGNWFQLVVNEADSTSQKFQRFVAKIQKDAVEFSGKRVASNGEESLFTAKRITNEKNGSSEDKKEKDKDKEKKSSQFKTSITYPNMAYGRANVNVKPEVTLFKNATVITGEADGTLEGFDVLVKDGKITKIGQNLSQKGAKVIDASGKFLTAGIIDEHSHIAASSVNEGGHNSSAEVTMEDVVNPDDISIYRALAGGVTTTQLLHGSANPIGGRSAILKLKWGESAKDMIYTDSPKFIKFALGENVKQSNWGNRTRFPQTRMGVEQVFEDYFTRARLYGDEKKTNKDFRYDEEMETLLEILNGERFISCHSYVQSEINMLMKVAERHGFTVNTFTHILEGYKLADKMSEHGSGGSTFSDWWAYKNEVKDAIPYNAALMHEQGVLVAINSDDGEMIRRLNQEAAKSMKYGSVSAEDAWNFVTLNPAKLLHIDNRVGSIKEGKDADLVLWNQHPLSVYAKAEITMIEGVVYFDLEEDKKMREAIAKERNSLIELMLLEKNKGMKTQPIVKKKERHMHCDTLDEHLFEN